MKALVTGFHMLYRLSPDSKYPWSGENTGPIEIPVLNIPLLEYCTGPKYSTARILEYIYYQEVPRRCIEG